MNFSPHTYLTGLTLLLPSCTSVDLYGQGLENPEADRLALTGRVCTDDARTAGFPVRVLFMMDTAGGPLFTEFDPELIRVRALSESVGLYSGNTYRFAVGGFAGNARKFAPL